jgi:hypothetical protein
MLSPIWAPRSSVDYIAVTEWTAMNRRAAPWFSVAGVLTLVGWTLFTVGDPVYYDAATLGDLASVASLSGCLVLTGIALIVLWRDPPVTRGSPFLLLAGAGAVAEGLGNLLEDAFGVEEAVWAFFGGGLLLMVSLLVAGTAALTASSPRRWAGLFLLFAVPGGMLGFGLVMMGTAWVLFGLWIASEHRAFVIGQAVVALPAAAIAIDLYWADVVG